MSRDSRSVPKGLDELPKGLDLFLVLRVQNVCEKPPLDPAPELALRPPEYTGVLPEKAEVPKSRVMTGARQGMQAPMRTQLASMLRCVVSERNQLGGIRIALGYLLGPEDDIIDSICEGLECQ
jgi:hypothetical protein